MTAEKSSLLISFEIELDADAIQHRISEKLRDTPEYAGVKGFRRDNPPLSRIIKTYGDEFVGEVFQELIVKRINECVRMRGDDVAGGTSTRGLWSIWDRPLRYKYYVEYEVFPDVIPFRGLDKLQYRPAPPAAVDAGVVDAYVENLRREKSPWRSVDRAARLGDTVVASFDGLISEGSFPGGTAENVRLALGAGGILPDFEAPFVGMHAGQTLQFSLRFPDDYRTTFLAGKVAIFTAEIRDVQEHDLLPLDFAFFERCGMPGTHPEFRAACIANLQKQHDKQAQHDADNDILAQFVAFNPIELPNCVVATYLQDARAEQAKIQRVGVDEVETTQALVSLARHRAHIGILVRFMVSDGGLVFDAQRPEGQQVVEWLINIASQNRALASGRSGPDMGRS
jgi:trigger factor